MRSGKESERGKAQEHPSAPQPHARSNGHGNGWDGAPPGLQRLKPPEPSPEAMERIWRRITARIQSQGTATSKILDRDNGVRQRIANNSRPGTAHAPSRPEARRRATLTWRSALSIALVFALLLVLSVNSLAASALPGSPLYSVKLTGEAIRLKLALDDADRARLTLSFADRRRAEVDTLVAQHASAEQVQETLRRALDDLSAAAPFVAPAEINARLDQWQREIDQWPSTYRDAAERAIQDWKPPVPSQSPMPRPISPVMLPTQQVAVPTETPGPLQNVMPPSVPTATVTDSPVPSSTATHAGVIPTRSVRASSTPRPHNTTAATPTRTEPPKTSTPLPTGTLNRPTAPSGLPLPTPPVDLIPPGVGSDPLQLPTAEPTAQPSPSGQTFTPAPTLPVTVPTLARPSATSTLPRTASPVPTSPPTVPPTVSVPTLPLPTPTLPTLPLPTPTLPTLPLPTPILPSLTPIATLAVPTLPSLAP